MSEEEQQRKLKIIAENLEAISEPNRFNEELYDQCLTDLATVEIDDSLDWTRVKRHVEKIDYRRVDKAKTKTKAKKLLEKLESK